jgi:ribonuclease HII
MTVPTLRHERSLLRSRRDTLLAGVDEVGRGALGGMVTVGVVLVDEATRTAPAGVRDSKLLTPAARERLAPKLARWGLGHGVGHASAAEIDEVGILAALRLAAVRALAQLPEQPDVILLDGGYDWLSARALWDEPVPPVLTRVKADLTCASVAAASVLAKTQRDSLMVELAREHPPYLWEQNKGYASPEHLDALRVHGPCLQHRRSWRLPGGAWGAVGAADSSL